MKLTRIVPLLVISIICSGCVVLPIPHKRLHMYGLKGRIIDADSKTPVAGAMLVTEDLEPSKQMYSSDNGSFSIPPEYGWHGAFLLGPISLSLFPGFDLPCFCRRIKVTATGYQTESFIIGEASDPRRIRAWIYKDSLMIDRVILKRVENYQQRTEPAKPDI